MLVSPTVIEMQIKLSALMDIAVVNVKVISLAASLPGITTIEISRKSTASARIAKARYAFASLFVVWHLSELSRKLWL